MSNFNKTLDKNYNFYFHFLKHETMEVKDLRKYDISYDEILRLNERRIINITGNTITLNNLYELNYYRDKAHNIDRNLGIKFEKLMYNLNKKYNFNFLTSLYGLMYTSLLMGAIDDAYSYFKYISETQYTKLIKYMFSYVTELDELDKEEVKKYKLEDLLLDDEILSDEIISAIYKQQYTYAFKLLYTTIEDNRHRRIAKEQIFIKNLCKIAMDTRTTNFEMLYEYIDKNDFDGAEKFILSESKLRKLNKRETVFLKLINTYKMIENGIIPEEKGNNVKNLYKAIEDNQLLIASSNAKMTDPSLYQMLKKVINKIIEIKQEEINEEITDEFYEYCNNNIELVKNSKECILLKDLSYNERLILFTLLDEEKDVTIYRLGNNVNYRFILFNNSNLKDNEFYYMSAKADYKYKKGEYKEAVNYYKESLANLGRPLFSMYLHLGNCYGQLGNAEMADNYYMMNYYIAFNNQLPYRTHKYIDNLMSSYGSSLRNKPEFYESLAKELIYNNESYENLRRNFNFTDEDRMIIVSFMYYLMYNDTKDCSFLQPIECIKNTENSDKVMEYISYIEEKIIEDEKQMVRLKK